jgi:hypothetical protein
MFTGRALAKYVAAVAIGASAGGMLGYEIQRLPPRQQLHVAVPAGKYAPVLESRLSELFQPLVDVLR